MRISAIELNNFRCFANASIELSEGINLIIGSNNSGKSTLLKAVSWLQEGAVVSTNDLRILQEFGFVQIRLNDALESFAESASFLNYLANLSVSDAQFKISNDVSIKVEISKNKIRRDYEVYPIGSSPIWIKKDKDRRRLILDHEKRVGYRGNKYSEGISNLIPKNFIQPYLSRRKVFHIAKK